MNSTQALNALMPTLYAALDIVSREMVGFLPAVSVNAAPTQAALNENIHIPMVNSAAAENIVPGTPSSNGAPNLDGVQMAITKSRMVPVRWNGEQQLGVSNSGTYNIVQAQQFAQAMRTLINEMEADIAALYKGASRAYGSAGTQIFSSNAVAAVAQARKILADNGSPMTDLQLVIDTLSGANLRSASNLFKANEAGTDATLRRGELLNLMGFSIRESAQIVQHSGGSVTGSALVNNASGYAKGAKTIAVDGATAIALKAGDLVKFGSDDAQYVLDADADATPLAIAAPGLVASVADNAAVTPVTSYTPCLAFDRNALQLIARAPAMPEGGDSADDITVLQDPLSGIPFQVCVYRGYREVRYEVGIAWGVKLIKPEHVALLIS